ncbi:four-carbon acid sugar kinase family protein [Amycolatopsis sp. cmx-4-68]|uniref:four-carbon acid sugar kinase family protein n=1 Tax=Amycolatopsis sp. cmx-4-68 TaxID=2790938 RepID=UPI00397865A7
MPELLVLGDDLTGSNATGARYARFGLRAVSVNALMVNLGTRHAPPAHAVRPPAAPGLALNPVLATGRKNP